MNPFKQWFKNKFRINFDSLTPVKQHCFQAFNAFNDIAEPEIKSNIMRQAFEFVKDWIASKMLEKPDNELKNKMWEVYKKMAPLFKDVEISAEIQASEALGSIKVPRLGELAKKTQLTDSVKSKREALAIMRELIDRVPS